MASRGDRRAACTSGQCAATPRSTSGRVDAYTCSGTSPAGTWISSTGSAPGQITAVPAFDQGTEMGERRNRHVDRMQVAGLVQLMQRDAIQCGQPVLVDRVEAGQPVA